MAMHAKDETAACGPRQWQNAHHSADGKGVLPGAVLIECLIVTKAAMRNLIGVDVFIR